MYSKEYFSDAIFDTDYAAIAKIIADKYQPKTVLEIGCGPGKLTKALSVHVNKIVAFDGFSNPEFNDYSNIMFHRLDLNNNTDKVKEIQDQHFDIAICMEVAEHINPQASASLIKLLTKHANVVIFTAAVPNQGGHGHINCQPRTFWNKLFVEQNFTINTKVMPFIQSNENIAIWYRLNITDYVKNDSDLKISESEIIHNLLESQSFASSMFYQSSNNESRLSAVLNQFPTNFALKSRNILKRILGKNA